MLVDGETLLKVGLGKETWTAKFIVCPELAWDVILGADFLRYTKAILNFAEGTFSTHEATGVNTDTSLPKDDADDICNALFEAAAIPMNNLDDLCAQLTHISNYERKELRQLLLKYAKIFSWQGVRLGRTNIVKHKIDTGEARPIWQPPRRIPPPLLEEVNRLVEEMLRDEVIKPSKSPWASPVALVKKNDGSLRLCIDYRKLNAVTKTDAFPLPHINDSLDSLHGSQWFSTLDLKSGYWQVEVAEADREKTAFILPNGLYEFQTMPFGLCNAAATFQRLMQTALIDLFPKHCVIYLDDILVFGGDIQEHNANLKLVLDRLRDARLTLNPKKCHFLQRSVTFLGHTVSSNGIAVTGDRVQQVRTWPTPTNQTELRSFLGSANYYRRFVKGFAKIASLLHKLTEKQAKNNFKWEKEHDEAFKELKRMLCSTPIPALPNFESSAPPFILDTDASDVAVGGVLSQKDIKGREHVIAYANTRLSKKMRQKSATQRELFAICSMVRHFRHYLIARTFIGRTGHQALTWLKTMQEIDRSVALWYEELQQYDFTVQYRKGKGHGNADALSRRPTPEEAGDVTVHTVFLSDPTRHHWRNTQSTDPDTALKYEKFLASSHKPASEEITSASKAARRIWQEWSRLSLEDEILWYQEGAHSPKRLVVPGSLVQAVLQELHEQLGHVGEKKMLDASNKRYWWPSLTLDVRDFCRTCTTCSGFKNPQPTAIAHLQPMPTGFPGERVGINIMGPLPPTKRENRYILVMVDYFTKAAEAEPVNSQDAETHGVPESVHSDQGPNFESRLFIELCKMCRISKTRTTPAHPQGNGKVERTNRTLIGLLKAFTKDSQPDDWDLSLGRVLLAYRATVHTSTGVSPFKMLTGRDMRVPSDIFVPNTDGSADCVPEYILRLKESIRRTFNTARKHSRLSYTRQKIYYDRHCRTKVYREGDLVQIYRPVPPPGTHRKFHHPWSRDPFRVVKALASTNYLVCNAQLRTQPVTVHHNKMRPYKGPPPVGYKDEVYVQTEDRRPPVRNLNGSS
ncbi:RNA directed DNA polymerase reverse transcriptase [Echinococcus multilocularis]|uniref:RNA directed DNA polymerase reverse transcriptase n=1 Tax=Echinococcus multilocularis TaxID=6211 RepID=A0A068Y3Y7_ECHMU|nr:RNA directed DNA polymerase reverse transcriptase [Echinococcus multilocularis]